MNTLGEYVTCEPQASSRTALARAVSSASGSSSRSTTCTSGARRVFIARRTRSGSARDVGGGEGLLARRAPEALLQALAARFVHEDGRRSVLAGEVAVAPAHERHQDR